MEIILRIVFFVFGFFYGVVVAIDAQELKIKEAEAKRTDSSIVEEYSPSYVPYGLEVTH